MRCIIWCLINLFTCFIALTFLFTSIAVASIQPAKEVSLSADIIRYAIPEQINHDQKIAVQLYLYNFQNQLYINKPKSDFQINQDKSFNIGRAAELLSAPIGVANLTDKTVYAIS